MKLISQTFFIIPLLHWTTSNIVTTAERCQVYYEWTLTEDTRINDTNYYAFQLDETTGIGTFTLPVYETLELTGDPIAVLRGSMIAANNATDFTATATLSFFSSTGMEHLGVHVSYSYHPEDESMIYGFTTGGTGRFCNYKGSAIAVVVATVPKFTVEWTLCDERSFWWWMWW